MMLRDAYVTKELAVICSLSASEEREREESACRVSRGVCWTVALALLFAGGGDDGRRLPLSPPRRVQRWSLAR